MIMDRIVLKNVKKVFTTKGLGSVVAVDNLNLNVKEGELLSLLGPSGCGKTTTLRMIAGFEDLTTGEIWIDDKPVSIKDKNLYVPPENRGLGMVFQAFAVWPHLNIFENVAFPLKVKKMNRSDIEKKVKSALKHTKLSGLENSYPSDLSGGQLQRIALARAIVIQPKVMLLDEPLSNLDPKLRESMRFEIKELQERFNFTVVFVTHDQAEAMAISDRMVVMDMGKIVQVDTPKGLYTNPKNKFVYRFLGLSNFIDVELSDGKVYPKDSRGQAIPCDIPADFTERSATIATRPNEIEINRKNGYKTKVEKRIFLPNYIEYRVKVGNQEVRIQTPHQNEYQIGETCFINFSRPTWYKADEETGEEERQKRQII